MTASIETFEKKLFSMTSIIKGNYTLCGDLYSLTASGFFYTEQTPTEPENKGPQWVRIDNYWFITNRHVVLPKEGNDEDSKEVLLDRMEFGLRRTSVERGIEWFPVSLSKEELKENLRLHPDKSIDVVAIDITKKIREIIDAITKKELENNISIPATISNRDLPGEKPIPIEVTSDIIVASYPKGFYDVVNKFPIVKSGIIASAWGANFNGKPLFQIDAQLFPGSSGGLVISKPTNWGIQDGHMAYTLSKEFVLLGVYSGEPIFKEKIVIDGKQVMYEGKPAEIEKSYGLGNVWYSYLIPEIISRGIKYNE